jgi:glutathione synthase/RimK-type ligase-like ATP-grasp enzyme
VSRDARPVLLVGGAGDAHVAALAARLREDGVEAVCVDTLAFPDQTRVTLGEGLDAITVDGRRIERPGAVYLRQLHAHPLAFGVDAQEEMDTDWRTTLVAFREKASLLRGLVGRWEALGVPVYNPLSTEWRGEKPLQISLLRDAGLPVPETLWTNHPEAVRHFAAGRRVAYKPVTGGAATRELSPEDLTEDRLATLGAAPVTFQQLLPGEDLRVYVIDGEVVASLRIVSRALDFRQNEERIEPFELSPELARICVRATEVIGLRWTGMDLKLDVDGTPRILELNGSAMFLGFDARAGTDILGRLAGALAGAARQ